MMANDPTFELQSNNPKLFCFSGTSLSLQARIDSLPDEEIKQIVDANITITGLQLQPMNNYSRICTITWGSIIILPLFFMVCNWWQKCTYPLYEIQEEVYVTLGRLIRGGYMSNLTLTIADSCFDSLKAQILYDSLYVSGLRGFTLNNVAYPLDYRHKERSDFEANTAFLKMIPNLTADIRWNNNYC